MEKITKKNIYTAIINMVDAGTLEFDTEDGMVEVPMETLRQFAEKEIALLDKKAAKAKETAAKKKAESDALQAAVQAVLTDEYTIIADIAAKVEAEDVTVAKVTRRLTNLVEAGIAEKNDVKIPGTDGKKTRVVKGYRLTQVVDYTA